MKVSIREAIALLQKELDKIKGAQLRIEALEQPTAPGDAIIPLAAIERQAILAAVSRCHGNKIHAAKALGIGKTTIFRKMHEYEAQQRVTQINEHHEPKS